MIFLTPSYKKLLQTIVVFNMVYIPPPQLIYDYFVSRLVEKGRQIDERVTKRLEKENLFGGFYDDGTPIGEFIWMDRKKFLSEHFGTLYEWNILVIYHSASLSPQGSILYWVE